MPKIEQNGVDIHRNLSGIIFNYWASLDEDICYLEIKDFRTLYQKKESQWLENIDSQVFRNSKDAKMWLIKEVSKYCGFTARNY